MDIRNTHKEIHNSFPIMSSPLEVGMEKEGAAGFRGPLVYVYTYVMYVCIRIYLLVPSVKRYVNINTNMKISVLMDCDIVTWTNKRICK